MKKIFAVFAILALSLIIVGCTPQDTSRDDVNAAEDSGNSESSNDSGLDDSESEDVNWSDDESDDDSEDSGSTQTGNNSPSAGSGSNDLPSSPISANELKIHNSRSDCWVAYKNKVYDITTFLPQHPGSAEAIIPYCGTSSKFENAFTDQHGTSKVGVLIEKSTFKGDFAN